MARTEIFISAPPKRVFELLSDPSTYAEWVVGSREIHAADPQWPEPGTSFEHSVGRGPLVVHDRTSVTNLDSPVLLELQAGAGPLGSARVTFQLEPEGNGTRVTLTEDPSSRLLSVLIGPLGHGLLRLRNRETLRRLKQLGERARRG